MLSLKEYLFAKIESMQSFLYLCANELVQKYGTNLSKCCIVLPTRRSGLVLNSLLQYQQVSDLPQIKHIEEFVLESTGMKKTSPVMLLLELYEIFTKIDPKLKLEKFTAWGYILLKDFDQIDRNLVDASKLFQTLGDIKNMERWKLDQAHQTQQIREYFELWENLELVYTQFRERLQKDKQAYMGMMYRHLAENTQDILIAQSDYDQYIFVGFNALSKAEEEVFKTLLKHEKAELVWDADDYYMKEPTENKAGEFLRKYKKTWIGTNWQHTTQNLLESKKEIEIIKVANASLQGKVANQLLKNWDFLGNSEGKLHPTPHTAIVLADEDLVLPMLNSLSEEYVGLNITMGLALKNSALFNLIDTLYEQHQTSIKDKTQENTYKFSYRTILKILNHPLVKVYEKRVIDRVLASQEEESTEENSPKKDSKSLFLALLNYINRNNLIFLSKQDLLQICQEDSFQEKYSEAENAHFIQVLEQTKPFLDIVFQRWKNTFAVIRAFEDMVALLNQEETYFESEYLREFSKIIKDLKYFVEKRPKFIDIRTFKIFLYQAFRETKFDFDSEQDTPLQLTGIVETRNLDFDNVIMLSVNEDTLPRSRKQNSFIPIDVCNYFGIPTYKEQDAVVSYHFYRLLQRASKIALVYVLPSDTYGGSEKSRFIHQIENDLLQQNPQIILKEYTAKLSNQQEDEESELTVAKNPEILAKMQAKFLKGISPSNLNAFINCSLQYYFSQIAEIGQSSSVEESLGMDKFGSIIHEILEEIYRDICQKAKETTIELIEEELENIEERVEEKFTKDIYANYILTGTNYITKKVTSDFIRNFLKAQIKEIANNKQPFEIITLENKKGLDEMPEEEFRPTISATFEAEIQGETRTVKIKGITDRVDKVGKKIRIIDYKTGKVESSQLKISSEELEKLISEPSADKVRQLWLYKYIVAKRVIKNGSFELGDYKIEAHEPISAGIYSMRNVEAGFLELAHAGRTKEDKAKSIFPKELKQYVEVSEKYLSKIIENMLNPEEEFEKTNHTEICQFCAYQEICGR